MHRLATVAAALLIASPAAGQDRTRSWEVMVSEGRERSYLANHYAPAVRIGDLVFVSGVVGNIREGDNAPEAQYRRAFRRLIDVLAEHGLELGDVAELTTYHVRLGELGEDFIRVKDEFLTGPPYPAWTAVGVEQLYRPVNLIEIRAVAVMPTAAPRGNRPD